MDFSFNPSPSDAHPDTMDFLSRTWCNFAVQTLQPELQDRSVVLLENSIKKFESDINVPLMKMESSMRMDNNSDAKPLPPWKSNDVKSWIWMQQAMHPELNYNSYFRKKWLPWKIVPFKNISIKKWWKEIKLKRKEEERLQRAEVHAAISVAGVAAALAAIAAENSKKNDSNTNKEAAIASAAALVAAQCAQVAEAMGAKREQLSTAIGSAMSGTSSNDIFTLTAAAATSLKGATTLKARSRCKNKLSEIAPMLPIEDKNEEVDFDFEKCRLILAKGSELGVETQDGKYMVRSVSVILNSEAKIILKIRKLNLLKSKKESVIHDLHGELYKDSEAEENETSYLIVLKTDGGTIKLDMGDDYHCYKTWSITINHMLMLSTSLARYHVEFYNN